MAGLGWFEFRGYVSLLNSVFMVINVYIKLRKPHPGASR